MQNTATDATIMRSPPWLLRTSTARGGDMPDGRADTDDTVVIVAFFKVRFQDICRVDFSRKTHANASLCKTNLECYIAG